MNDEEAIWCVGPRGRAMILGALDKDVERGCGPIIVLSVGRVINCVKKPTNTSGSGGALIQYGRVHTFLSSNTARYSATSDNSKIIYLVMTKLL